MTRLDVSPSIIAELERRMLLVYLGVPHNSSAIHEAVIADLSRAGPTASHLAVLRKTAEQSAHSLLAGDLEAFGRVMIANTEAQRRLHHGLVSALADRVISAAMRHGALGYKVNGAGGDGGAITLLTNGDPAAMARTVAAVEAVVTRRSMRRPAVPLRLGRAAGGLWLSDSHGPRRWGAGRR